MHSIQTLVVKVVNSLYFLDINPSLDVSIINGFILLCHICRWTNGDTYCIWQDEINIEFNKIVHALPMLFSWNIFITTKIDNFKLWTVNRAVNIADRIPLENNVITHRISFIFYLKLNHLFNSNLMQLLKLFEKCMDNVIHIENLGII